MRYSGYNWQDEITLADLSLTVGQLKQRITALHPELATKHFQLMRG